MMKGLNERLFALVLIGAVQLFCLNAHAIKHEIAMLPHDGGGGTTPVAYVPRDYPTIQAAIDAVPNRWVIRVEPGVYSGEGNANLIANNRILKIESQRGSGQTTIECDDERTTGFSFQDSEIVLEGFTIFACDNSAVIAEGGDITIIDNHFIGNGVSQRSVIQAYTSNIVINQNSFIDNYSYGSGNSTLIKLMPDSDAIYEDRCNLELSNNSINHSGSSGSNEYTAVSIAGYGSDEAQQYCKARVAGNQVTVSNLDSFLECSELNECYIRDNHITDSVVSNNLIVLESLNKATLKWNTLRNNVISVGGELILYVGVVQSRFLHNDVTYNFLYSNETTGLPRGLGVSIFPRAVDSNIVVVAFNKFQNNQVLQYASFQPGTAGAIYLDGATMGGVPGEDESVTASVHSNIIVGNTGDIQDGAAGITCVEVSCAISNNLIAQNSSDSVGAALCNQFVESCTFINNTIVSNQAANGIGGIVLSDSPSNFVNNIIWGNGGLSDVQISTTKSWGTFIPPLGISYTILEGGVEGIYSEHGIAEGPRVITEDPNLASNYRPRSGSPAIDSGDANQGTFMDIENSFRCDEASTQNTGVGPIDYLDIGAYERACS